MSPRDAEPRINPWTPIVETAAEELVRIAADLVRDFRVPLFVKLKGITSRAALEWPKDPMEVTPEEMQHLIDTRGEEAVDTWLAEHFAALAERGDVP